MIINLEGTPGDLEAARRSLEAMAYGWGYEISEAPEELTMAAGVCPDPGNKAIDPLSVAALALSIPSAALAVLDLADRACKRRRARQMIDQAKQLAAQRVIVCLTSRVRTVELRTLDPDQLLDILASQDPAS